MLLCLVRQKPAQFGFGRTRQTTAAKGYWPTPRPLKHRRNAVSCCFSVGERWSERISGPRGGLRLPRRIVMVVLERHSAASRLRRVEVAAAIVMVDNVFKRDEDAVVHVGHVGRRTIDFAQGGVLDSKWLRMLQGVKGTIAHLHGKVGTSGPIPARPE